MHTLLFALLLAPLLQSQEPLVGNPEAGRAKYFAAPGAHPNCMLCHGRDAEGGWGPDLGGARGLTFPQFVRAIREPWGLMPKFTQTDQDLADLYAYLLTVPRTTKVGEWRQPLPPPGSPTVQEMFIGIGCGQCHGPELIHPRRDLGRVASDVDFSLFKGIIYQHAPARMGVFNPGRVPETTLQEIFRFIMDEGLRVPLWGEIDPGVPSGGNTTYTYKVWNDGTPGKGLTAEGVAISMTIPPGATVVSATGPGYQGVSTDPKTNVRTAVWKAATFKPADNQSYTVTLSGKAVETAAFKGSSVAWDKPGSKRVPGLTMRDDRVPEHGDIIVAPGVEFLLAAPPKPH